MKSIILTVVILLLVSCEKKLKEVQKDVSENQKSIVQYYNKSLQKDKTLTDTLSISPQELEALALKEPKEFQAMVAIVLGLKNSNKGLYQLGIKNYEKAMSLLQNSAADSLNAKALNGIGNNYKNIGDYQKAIKSLYESLALYEQNNNAIGICSVNNILGDVYFQMDQPEKAKTFIQAGMKVLDKQKSSSVYLSAAHSLANFYGMTGDFDNALKIDEMGIRVCDSINDPAMKVSFLDNKANCYLFSNRMDSAYFYFNECLKLDLIIGNKRQIADTYSNLGQFFMMKKNYLEAEKQIEKSIELLKAMDAKPNLGKSYAILSEIYTNQNQYKKAYAIQKEQMANKRLMIEEKEAASLSEYQIVYETQKKESKIHFLELENSVRNLTIREQTLRIKRKNYLILFFGLLMTVFLVVAYIWRNHHNLKSELDRAKTIKETEEAERVRMAKDIHDDLGSGLSKINFLSEIISQKTKELPEIKHSSESIKETAKKMIDNMRDLIWALNPENATLAILIARMREYTTDYFEDYTTEIEYSFPDYIPQAPIRNEIHRGLFLVVKEVINNISKHSKATKIDFKVAISDAHLILTIIDNGIGYLPQHSNGNGLKNMLSRMEDIGGMLSVKSTLEVGTEVKIEIKLTTIYKN